jgi:hypothetical protein
MTTDTLQTIGLLLIGGMVISTLLAGFIFVLAIRGLRRIQVPAGAGFSETLLYTPFIVVVFIDLLDWGLDILAAPIAWVVLDRLGLKALRGVSAVEALIPFTQFIPTMTLCWLGVRFLGVNVDTLTKPKNWVEAEYEHTS